MKETTKPKLFCFVLMPFDESFDDIYTLGIKESCIAAGAYCERVDEQIFNETILERIYNQIAKADVVIADMTGRNPNVFYEVGYAHALGKPTILMTQNSDDIPFDLKHFPHIIYKKKIITLKDQLTQKITWFVENPEFDESEYKVGIELFLNEDNLSSKKVIYKTPEGKIPHPKITIQNASPNTYYPEDFQIGIVTSENLPNLSNRYSKVVRLPNGKLMHMLQHRDEILFPNSFTSFQATFSQIKDNIDEDILFRIFTKSGYRDFPLNIKYSRSRV